MSKKSWNSDKENEEWNKKNMFRCALPNVKMLIMAIDGAASAFIHKVLSNTQPTAVFS